MNAYKKIVEKQKNFKKRKNILLFLKAYAKIYEKCDEKACI